jgi:hypothetical protein
VDEEQDFAVGRAGQEMLLTIHQQLRQELAKGLSIVRLCLTVGRRPSGLGIADFVLMVSDRNRYSGFGPVRNWCC